MRTEGLLASRFKIYASLGILYLRFSSSISLSSLALPQSLPTPPSELLDKSHLIILINENLPVSFPFCRSSSWPSGGLTAQDVSEKKKKKRKPASQQATAAFSDERKAPAGLSADFWIQWSRLSCLQWEYLDYNVIKHCD